MANPIATEGSDCSTFDNLYWNHVDAYASNSATYEAAELCGSVAANQISINDEGDRNAIGMLELVKMGGTVECPILGK